MARRRSRGSKTASSASSPKPASRRRSGAGKRWLIALLVVVVAVVGLCHKGLMAEPEEKLAASVDQGTVVQVLVDAKTSRKVVQGSAVIAAPMDKVWSVISDYAHYSEMFPEMKDTKVERTADGRRRLSGTISLSPLPISWKTSMKINHEQTEKSRLAEWDEPADGGKINRGFWKVEDLGDGKSRLIHRIDTAVMPFPGFVLRAAIYSKMDDIFKTVAERAAK